MNSSGSKHVARGKFLPVAGSCVVLCTLRQTWQQWGASLRRTVATLRPVGGPPLPILAGSAGARAQEHPKSQSLIYLASPIPDKKHLSQSATQTYG